LSNGRTQGDGHKVKCEKFPFDLRIFFFFTEDGKSIEDVAREAVGS